MKNAARDHKTWIEQSGSESGSGSQNGSESGSKSGSKSGRLPDPLLDIDHGPGS